MPQNMSLSNRVLPPLVVQQGTQLRGSLTEPSSEQILEAWRAVLRLPNG